MCASCHNKVPEQTELLMTVMYPQVDSEAVRREQQEALDRVSAAVTAAQEILAGGTLETGKRKAGLQDEQKPSKRARIYGFEDLSSDSDDDSEYEAAARLSKAGQVAATMSSGDDSQASAQESALATAQGCPDAPDISAPEAAKGGVQPSSRQVAASSGLHSSFHNEDIQRSSYSPWSPVSSQPLPSATQKGSTVIPDTAPAAARAQPAAVTPAESAAVTHAESEVVATAELKATTPADQPANPEAAIAADQSPVDLAEFSSSGQLESIGMIKLKNELSRHGLKCGGSLSERAARLFLLKFSPLDQLDQQHFSKATKKKQSKKL